MDCAKKEGPKQYKIQRFSRSSISKNRCQQKKKKKKAMTRKANLRVSLLAWIGLF
jgi:hypothetical protein